MTSSTLLASSILISLCCWRLLVSAQDAAGSIYFIDLDHEPRIYVAAPSGVMVTTITAIRQDVSELRPRYMLHGNSSDTQYFQIHPQTGNITTRRYIDRPVGSKYMLVVAAYANEEVAYINLSIRVVEYNRYPPIFNSSNYIIWVDKRTPIGTIVLQVYALDKDTKSYNSEINYSMEKQSMISINRYTGQLVLREKLPADKNNLTFTITAEDGGSPRRLSQARVTLVMKSTAESCQANNTTDYLCYCSNYMNGSICFMNKTCGNIEHTCFTSRNCSRSNHFTFSCECPAGYYGPNCKNYDPCLYSPCLHRAMCVGKLNFQYICRCEAGHAGVYCERKTDDCSSQPCFNSGTCIDASNSYVCSCAEGYSGKRCEEYVDQCPDETVITDKGIFKWPSVQYGKKAIIPCPYNSYQMLTALHWGEDAIYLENNENSFNREENLISFHKTPHIFLKGNYDEFNNKNNKDFQLEHLNQFIQNFPNMSHRDGYLNYGANYAVRECRKLENGTIFWGKTDDSTCRNKLNLFVIKTCLQLEQMTREPAQINASVFVLATKQLKLTWRYALTNNEIAQVVIMVISNLMAVNTTVLDECDKNGTLSQDLVRVLNDYCSNTKLPYGEEIIASENVVLKTTDVTIDEDALNEGVSFYPVHERNGLRNTQETEVLYKNTSLTIPGEILMDLKNQTKVRIFFVSFTNSKFFRSSDNSDTNQRKSQEGKISFIDQQVITATVLNISMVNLTEAVTYALPNIYGDMKQTCVYWEPDSQQWHDSGLTTNQSEHVINCYSSHMTAFSVHVSLAHKSATSHEYIELTYLAYLGSVCGILILVIAIATLTFSRNLNVTHTGRIFVNLCVSLILANLSFLTLALKDYVTLVDVCTSGALLNHYLVPVCLIWMVFVAVDMYYATTDSNAGTCGPSFMLNKIFFAWILPFIAVAFCAAYDLEFYKSDETAYCFFNPQNMYIYCTSYLAPCCAIMGVNFVMLSIVSKNLIRRKDVGKVTVTNTQVLCAVVSAMLFGVTWVFGTLVIAELRYTFQYVFSAVNLLLGVAVLYMCCVQQPCVWSRLLPVLKGSGADQHPDATIFSFTHSRPVSQPAVDAGASRDITASLSKLVCFQGQRHPENVPGPEVPGDQMLVSCQEMLDDYALDLTPARVAEALGKPTKSRRTQDDIAGLSVGLPVIAASALKPVTVRVECGQKDLAARGEVSFADQYFSRKEGIYSSWQYLKMPLKGIMKSDKLKDDTTEKISVVERGNKQMSQSFNSKHNSKKFTYINTKTVIISDQSYISGGSTTEKSLRDTQLDKKFTSYSGLGNPTSSNFFELKKKLDQNLSFRDFNNESYGLAENDQDIGQLSHIYCLVPQTTESRSDTFVVINGQTVYTNNPSVRLNLGEKNLFLPYGDASIRQATCKSNSRISIIRFDDKSESRKNNRYKTFLHNLSDSLNLGSDRDSCTSDSCDSTCNSNVRDSARKNDLKKFIKY